MHGWQTSVHGNYSLESPPAKGEYPKGEGVFPLNLT